MVCCFRIFPSRHISAFSVSCGNLVLFCFCRCRRRLPSAMVYGRKIGKLVQKYLKPVEPIPKRRGLSGRLSSALSFRSPTGTSGSDDSDSSCGDEDVEAPVGVPEGCLPVYVGPERRRFVVQASFLDHQGFRELLRRSEEEYGFETEGGLRIPCEAGDFEKLLGQIMEIHTGEDTF